MHFKIKQANNKFKLKYTERKYFFLKKIEKKRNKINKWGHEKMTIMFIPHNEKNIFNFQISKYIISFVCGMFLIVLIVSVLSFVNNAKIKSEEKAKLATYKEKRAEIYELERLSDSIVDLMDEIKPEVEDIYRMSVGMDNDELKNIWKFAETPENNSSEKKITAEIPDEIIQLKKIQKDMICSANTLKTVNTFIEERKRVIDATPSLVPVLGQITSFFGWRRSPFGFGADNHTGIDIAASEGTPVYAASNGYVVSAGWSGGYGQCVRIRHSFGYETLYGHNSRLLVKTGDYVHKGDRVALVGQTGSATGNHVHYEVILGGIRINPYPFLTKMW